MAKAHLCRWALWILVTGLPTALAGCNTGAPVQSATDSSANEPVPEIPNPGSENEDGSGGNTGQICCARFFGTRLLEMVPVCESLLTKIAGWDPCNDQTEHLLYAYPGCSGRVVGLCTNIEPLSENLEGFPEVCCFESEYCCPEGECKTFADQNSELEYSCNPFPGLNSP